MGQTTKDEKFTAGTWHAHDGQIYPEETGKTIALIPYYDKENEEVEANAQLIASAPTLYRENKRLKEFLVFTPDAAKEQWRELEVHPIWDDGKGNCEPCDEGQESFWSVYVHNISGGMQCIADLPTKELAYKLSELIENLVKSHSK